MTIGMSDWGVKTLLVIVVFLLRVRQVRRLE
jgi:hypothetical protein